MPRWKFWTPSTRASCRRMSIPPNRISHAMIELSVPFSEEKIRNLKVGDEVALTGVVFTGRDAVHKYLHDGGELPPEVKLRDGILYHCGPVVIKDENGQWRVTAA